MITTRVFVRERPPQRDCEAALPATSPRSLWVTRWDNG